MKFFLALLLLLVPVPSQSSPIVVDSGEDPSAWKALASPNGKASILKRPGAVGLDFELGGGRGHAIARRELSVDLPTDYMVVFALEGDCEPNTLEIKFISGRNVW